MSKLINAIITLVFVLATTIALGMFMKFLNLAAPAPTEAAQVAAQAEIALEAAEIALEAAIDLRREAAVAEGEDESYYQAHVEAEQARARATEARLEVARAWAAKAASEAAPALTAAKAAAAKAAAKAAAAKAAAKADKDFACAAAARQLLDAENGWAAVRAAQDAFNVETQPFSAEEARLLRLIGEELDCIEQVSRARAAEREAC